MEVKIGDIIKFGSYPQDEYGKTKAPIEWKVLDENDGKVLLMSLKGLDMVPYCLVRYQDVTWADSYLRKWLNEDFIQAAFSADEAKKIADVELENPANAQYGTSGCENTNDKVFVLSVPEFEKYLAQDPDKKAEPTEFAKMNGVYVYNENGKCIYWLRTPGYTPYVACRVNCGGCVSQMIYDDERSHRAARPCIWVKL